MTEPDKQHGEAWDRRTVLGGLTVAPAFLVAACGGGSPRTRDPRAAGGRAGVAGAGGSTGAPARVSTARITVTPADAAKNADFTVPVTVVVHGGTLTSVRLVGDDGRAVPGRMSAGATRWTSTGRLGISTAYRVSVRAKDASGLVSASNTRFTTKAPDHTFVGYFTPEDRSTSGVGMPVSINFSTPIAERRAVQRAIRVTAEPGVEIVGHWFGDTRLDFRPEHYWAPGTRITLSLRLKDLEGAPGVYGVQSKDVHFTIGRSQVSVVDLGTKQMTVYRDGRESATYPVSGGGPRHPTWEGRMVVSERFRQTRMNSRTVGLGGEYDIPDVPHAQRLTASGTFIHGNYWGAPSIFGHENTSHGCVGLRDVKGGRDAHTPAGEFYDSSMIGDVVEVVHSGDGTVAPDNGLNGWNMSWADWKAGSAL